MSNEYQLSFTATEIDEKLGKIDDLVSSAEKLTTHIDNTNNPHEVTVEKIGAVSTNDLNIFKEENEEALKEIRDNYIQKNPVYEATPTTLAEVISNAEPGSTIKLTKGTYDLLTLIPETGLFRKEDYTIIRDDEEVIVKALTGTVVTYPENLTIIGDIDENGNRKTFIKGISITSGQIKPSTISNNNYKLKMPSNLTFKDLIFTNSLCLRNCSIDGLKVLDCRFYDNGTEHFGANINIQPTRLDDKFGRDEAPGTKAISHWPAAQPYVNNILISGNTFDYASVVDDYTQPTDKGKNPDTTSAIYVGAASNVEVSNNSVKDTAFNGIQVNGKGVPHPSGKIAILNNRVSRSGSRGIRVANLTDAQLFVYENRLTDDNNAPEEVINEEHIKVSGCENTEYTWRLSTTSGPNVYKEQESDDFYNLAVGDGILIEKDKSTKWTDDKKAEVIAEAVDLAVAEVMATLPVYNGEVL